MFRHCRRALWAAPLLAAMWAVFGGTAPAWGHESRGVAGHQVVVGWDVEPAFTGVSNAAGVRVSEEGGEPVEGLKMKVEVIFGDQSSTQRTEPLDLEPAFRDPGKYSAPIVPSRPGTYTFHITGELDGEPFDQFFTSGEDTFDSISDPQEFPVKDPTRGELAEKTSRLESRIDSIAKSSDDAAGGAKRMAVAGIIIGAVALLVGLVAIGSRRRGGATPAGPPPTQRADSQATEESAPSATQDQEAST